MPNERSKEVTDRLLVIESFVDDPPDNEFQRGYLSALMEEAVEDILEAGSEIFDKALSMYDKSGCLYNDIQYRNWKIRRAKTLS